jgi:hypothetical protein
MDVLPMFVTQDAIAAAHRPSARSIFFVVAPTSSVYFNASRAKKVPPGASEGQEA